MAEQILVSACLLGQPVRYDGRHKAVGHVLLRQWHAEGRLLALCPELLGGLTVPREAAEIDSADGGGVLLGNTRVVTRSGQDVTPNFIRGAEQVLGECQQRGIRLAILKENSPSCGSSRNYDGSFSATLVAGQGVTAALLRQAGIAVFNEQQLDAAADYLEQDR
jgi:uncharacterized protein YbbK (DUF523 family)